MKGLGLVLALFAGFAWIAQAQWKLVYQFDEPGAELLLRDVAAPTRQFVVAAGVLAGESKLRPRLLVSRDEGLTWQLVSFPEPPLSVFFLNSNLGWVVGTRALWTTTDGARTWKRLRRPATLQRVWFLDEQRGYGVGGDRLAYQSVDGGRSWAPIPAEFPALPRERTLLGWVDFSPQGEGVLLGWIHPPHRDRSWLPDWAEPERLARQERVLANVLAFTPDGGRSWQVEVDRTDRRLVRLKLDAGSLRGALAVIQFPPQAAWASQVELLKPGSWKGQVLFRSDRLVVTDVTIGAGGQLYLVAVEPPGKLRPSPVPGKVHVLRWIDTRRWEEMEVDYRAQAREAMFAGDSPWLALDTGIVLKLTQEGSSSTFSSATPPDGNN